MIIQVLKQSPQILLPTERVVISYTPKSVTKHGESYDVLIPSDYLFAYQAAGYNAKPLFGSEKTFKISSRVLSDRLQSQGVPITTIDIEKRRHEKEIELRKKALSEPPRTKIKAAATRRSYGGKKDNYILNRTTVASSDECEICGFKEKHFRRGKPTSFDPHHTEGIQNSDTVDTMVRACAICHNAITRGAKDGVVLNNKAREVAKLAEERAKEKELDILPSFVI